MGQAAGRAAQRERPLPLPVGRPAWQGPVASAAARWEGSTPRASFSRTKSAPRSRLSACRVTRARLRVLEGHARHAGASIRPDDAQRGAQRGSTSRT
eukprot:15292577-Alexandrium_andersonii.AAC.1